MFARTVRSLAARPRRLLAATVLGAGAGLCFGVLLPGGAVRPIEALAARVLTPYEKAAAKELHTAAYNKPPASWTGPVFEPNFDWPSEPGRRSYPWQHIDFRTEPDKYLQTVLDFCLEGNVDEEGRFDTSVHKMHDRWFHAPWLHYGSKAGREPIHGLTWERPTPPLELNPNQTRKVQNWAIGFYNRPGAYIFGRIWDNPAKPNLERVKFPDGAVSFKLLFTHATDKELAYVKGSPEVQATIKASDNDDDPNRKLATLRLLQVDVAVADKRAANETGWVFGTFMYDGNQRCVNPWKRLIPVGLQWGNDPARTLDDVDKPLQQGWINPAAEKLILAPGAHRPFLGWAGRVNGPVDNFKSSCSSCHSTAQFPVGEEGLAPFSEGGVWNHLQKLKDATRKLFFRNVKAGEVFEEVDSGERVYPLDYSLQAMLGLRNFMTWRKAEFPNEADKAEKAAKAPKGIISRVLGRPTPGHRMTREIQCDKNLTPIDRGVEKDS